MVPARVGVLPEFPLTRAGKVDLKALRVPAALSTTESTAGKPTTKTQQMLIEIWREVLDTPDIGADSDFFELGGDSLRAMRVLARVAKVFGRTIPVQELMVQASTIRSLGNRIEELTG
jgi:acyl carrier protein